MYMSLCGYSSKSEQLDPQTTFYNQLWKCCNSDIYAFTNNYNHLFGKSDNYPLVMVIYSEKCFFIFQFN